MSSDHETHASTDDEYVATPPGRAEEASATRTTWLMRSILSTGHAPPPSTGEGGRRGVAVAMGELIVHLQRLVQRQRYRYDERTFARDVEKIVSQFRPSQADTHGDEGGDRHSGSSDFSEQAVSVDKSVSFEHPSEAHLHALLDCMGQLFSHRYAEVRAMSFDVINLSLHHFGHQLSSEYRRRVFGVLQQHAEGDFEERQRTLRTLIHDGRDLEPFPVELGWLLLQWLEDSDHQRDLLGIIQNIFRRSPLALDFENVIAITSIVCGRCDLAWTRGEIETCKRFLSFFHVIATHKLEHALSTSVCLRTLCCMVNADGQGTWSVMKHLLGGEAGFQVLRGLVLLLENPCQNNQWVLRGAVFFVGMSCWGSQRVAKLDQVKWAPILLALESCLRCENGVVIFEVILTLQRLIKKFGGGKTDDKLARGSSTTKRIVVEWDIILRIFRALRPWLSINEDSSGDESVEPSAPVRDSMGGPHTDDQQDEDDEGRSSRNVHRVVMPVYHTRIPRELIDTLLMVEDHVHEGSFVGELEDFYEVIEDYLPYLPERSIQLLLRHRAEAAHPAYHIEWLYKLEQVMQVFYADLAMPLAVREEALELLHVNLWTSRNICEDRVIEEVLIPIMAEVYDDPHAGIRLRGLDLIIQVARHLESVRFDTLLDILENAVMISEFEDSQRCAVAGIVSLFSTYFNHLPQSRALRMYGLIADIVESHRDREVRQLALGCLLHVCEASVDFRLQWKDNQVRTSRFLYCSHRHVRHQQTAAAVPVSKALRALLTLISTETDSKLFRMAVEGLRRMLKNRIVLSDVDVSDFALKLMSCVDYRAFGRAAVIDEISNVLDELDQGVDQLDLNDTSGRPRRKTDTDVAELLTRSRSRRNSTSGPLFPKPTIREVAASLSKTRFTTMGLHLLELFLCYEKELSDEVHHQLMICLVGALDNLMVVSKSDIERRDRANSSEAGSPARPGRLRSLSHGKSVVFTRCDNTQQTSAESSEPESSGALSHVPFASRMLSRFQSGRQSSSIFNVLSSTPLRGSPSPRLDSMTNECTPQFDECQRLLFDAEFELLRAACGGLSLLVLVASHIFTSHLSVLLSSACRCYKTADGEFRSDAYAVILELMGNFVCSGANLQAVLSIKILDVVLVAFELSVPKATSYLAFRILCEMVLRSSATDRTQLAGAALPVLRKLANGNVLVETAIDFLVCYALSKATPVAPALRYATAESRPPVSTDVVSSKSWIYGQTILTIEILKAKPAQLVLRRANATTRLHLAVGSTSSSVPMLSMRTQSNSRNNNTLATENGDQSQRRAKIPTLDLNLAGEMRSSESLIPSSRQERSRPAKSLKPARIVPSGVPSVLTPRESKLDRSRKQVSFAVGAPHDSPVPPLPAYDGIGGSPAYFYDSYDGRPREERKDMAADQRSTRDMEYCEIEELSLDDTAKDVAEDESTGQDVINYQSSEVLSAVGTPQTEDSDITPSPPSEHGSSPMSAHDSSSQVTRELQLSKFDPAFLMMQLFDISLESRPQPLSDGTSVTLGLTVFDRIPEFETHKIGLLYVRNGKQKQEADILGNYGGSLRYLKFLRELGTFTRLKGLDGYAGGLDTANDSDGKYAVLYRSPCLQIIFHVATMMVSNEDLDQPQQDEPVWGVPTFMKKKRHVGNDFVHIIFKECDEEYDVQTLSGQFNDVHIIVQPINDREYRTQVRSKTGIPPFGPLSGTQIIPAAILADALRLTCLNANLACQSFHQDLIGFTMNCEERLKQIKQLGARYTTTDEWMTESRGSASSSTP
ncbi:hypothetical protein Poli38472_006163 [Pythium oligandrum]|uniref:Rap-GAP domain-containing protein n=1 Tax=Pythium oligandrum TaxID=41045 RepID=A0A8K1CSE2_PYTOL|nr:hypothetical protein Poli38472_006163 [Pythium oligandrum]|eukprot:TMW68695.1 hypothetical protein Poli38472_006163 [Pythium oligandrum]